MDAKEIIAKLKNVPDESSFARSVRSELTQMNDADCDFLLLELRRQIENPENRDIYGLLLDITG